MYRPLWSPLQCTILGRPLKAPIYESNFLVRRERGLVTIVVNGPPAKYAFSSPLSAYGYDVNPCLFLSHRSLPREEFGEDSCTRLGKNSPENATSMIESWVGSDLV